MALTTKPDPLPSELTYVPPGGKVHRVATGQSWDSLAELPEVQAARVSANDLCFFNFKTRNPREINWYLYHKVGCRHVTHDGKNYMFSAADNPGVVYLPQIGARPAVNEIVPKKDEPRLEMWVGVGGKGGTMFVVAGIETMEGALLSLDPPLRVMALQASINRLGVGWGATVGYCIIVATGVREPAQLNGFQAKADDFTFTLGENWDKVARAAQAAKRFKPVIDVIAKIGARTPSALKIALKAEPDKYFDLIKAGRALKESLGSEAGERNVFIVDVPWGGTGAEISLFYGVANFTALYDSGT